MKVLRYVALAVLLCALSACGTSVNLVTQRKPYGGVKLDTMAVDATGRDALPLTVAAVADMPLSFVGDTVTAPILAAED